MSYPKLLTVSLALFFLLCTTLFSSAQELYFRNKPFKGPTSGSWDQMMVGLKETAQIFELSTTEENGVYLVGDSQSSGATAGQVVVNGKAVSAVAGESGPMVNLKEFAAAAELTYKPNRELGGIDVIKPGVGSAKGGTYFSEGVSNYVSKENPGAEDNVDGLAVAGKVTLVYLYHNSYSDKGYRDIFSIVDNLAKLDGVAVFKVPRGGSDSAVSKKFPATVPLLFIYDRSRRYRSKASGHGITAAGVTQIVDQLKKG